MCRFNRIIKPHNRPTSSPTVALPSSATWWHSCSTIWGKGGRHRPRLLLTPPSRGSFESGWNLPCSSSQCILKEVVFYQTNGWDTILALLLDILTFEVVPSRFYRGRVDGRGGRGRVEALWNSHPWTCRILPGNGTFPRCKVHTKDFNAQPLEGVTAASISPN